MYACDMAGAKIPVHRRIWMWLRTGQWNRHRGWSFGYVAPVSRWTKLRHAWQVLMGRRRAHPGPLLYLSVFAVGAVLGAVLQATLRVFWWIPPIALVVIAWLLFFATIWQKSPGETRTVRQELHRVFHPEEAMARDREKFAAMLRETPLRFFSPKHLTSQVGERLTINLGWGGSGEGLTEVTLHFWEGDPHQGEAQELGSVKTMLAANPQPEAHSEVHSEVHDEIHNALMNAALVSMPRPTTDEEARAHFEQAVESAHRQVEALEWIPTTITVNGRRHDAERALVNGTVFTNANLGDECVLIHQTPAWERHEAPIELVEITDREAIISRTLDV